MSETVIVELSAETANWVRDAITHEREDPPEAGGHYDPEDIARALSEAERTYNDALAGWSVGEGLVELVRQECSPAEAVDYYMTELRGISQTEWAGQRGVTPQSVNENVAKAKAKLDETED